MRFGLVAAAILALVSNGCNNLECGANTIEMNGKCVASGTSPGADCGPGTSYDPTSGECVDDIFADGGGICGSNTTSTIDDAGNHVCIGTGGSATDCSQDLPCPPTTMPSSVSLCGRIYDIEDSTPLDDGDPTNGEPYKNVKIEVLDPIAFVSDPTTAPILLTVQTDSCGRFVIADAPRPGTGYIAVVTDDADGQPDNLVEAGIAEVVNSGDVLTGLHGWIFRRTTDVAWSTAAGLPSGMTFGSLGVYIPIFLVPPIPEPPFTGSPDPGVTVVFDATPDADNDFYFSDVDPLTRMTVDPTLNATGMNGTGLYINHDSLGSAAGMGNAPAGSCWIGSIAAAPLGAAFIQERTPSETCP